MKQQYVIMLDILSSGRRRALLLIADWPACCRQLKLSHLMSCCLIEVVTTCCMPGPDSWLLPAIISLLQLTMNIVVAVTTC